MNTKSENVLKLLALVLFYSLDSTEYHTISVLVHWSAETVQEPINPEKYSTNCTKIYRVSC